MCPEQKSREFDVNAPILVAVALISTLVAGAYAYSYKDPLSPDSVASKTSGPLAQANRRGERVEAELILLSRRGFEPSEITRAAGRFLLMVNNQSGFREITLQLRRQDGSSIKETQVPRNKLRMGQVLELPPGRFVLTEAGHPEWVCNLVITP